VQIRAEFMQLQIAEPSDKSASTFTVDPIKPVEHTVSAGQKLGLAVLVAFLAGAG
jgi:hypothetical protein